MTTTDVVPDDAALRTARRERVLEAMESAGIDILITGRESNARYLAGVPRLWINGSLGFGPSAILVRGTQEIFLSNTWDEGVPDDIPRDNLWGITFNGENVFKRLKGLPGADTAATVATDGLGMSTERLVGTCFPQAQLVDAEGLLRDLRSTKLPAEVDAIRAAVAVTEASVAAVDLALAAGTTGRALTGIFMEAMAVAGVTTPTTQDVVWASSRTEPGVRGSRDTPLTPSDHVVIDAGVLAGGYVGELARTRCLDGLDAGLLRRWDGLWDRLLTACRPGATGQDLLDAYGSEPPPLGPVARGLGLGNDLPLVTHDLPGLAAAQRLSPGMVLTLTAQVWAEGVGAITASEPVLLTEGGAELLSADPFRSAR